MRSCRRASTLTRTTSSTTSPPCATSAAGVASGHDHGRVSLTPDAGDPAVGEPPAVRSAAQPVVVAARAQEFLALGQAKADMLGLVVARVLGLVTMHGGDMVAVQVMGRVESLHARADPGHDRRRPGD